MVSLYFVCLLISCFIPYFQSHKRQHESKEYKCEQCPAAFHRKQYLVTHKLSHTGERPFMCEACGKSYRCDHTFFYCELIFSY